MCLEESQLTKDLWIAEAFQQPEPPRSNAKPTRNTVDNVNCIIHYHILDDKDIIGALWAFSCSDLQ